MNKLIIGEIPYLNCVPFFHPLKKKFNHDFFEFYQGHPTDLNSALKRGQADVSISSSIEYCLGLDDYVVMPELCIASTGRCGSVLLFSDMPMEDLDDMTVSTPTASATSVALIKIILGKYLQFNNQFKASWAEAEAHLLIGDSALRERTLERYHYIYDLGEVWREYTGLPMVFAMWIARRDAAAEKHEQFAALHQALKNSVEFARLKEYKDLVNSLEGYEWMSRDKVLKYFKQLEFSLTSTHIKGLMRFYQDAEEMNIIEEAPDEIEFMEMPI